MQSVSGTEQCTVPGSVPRHFYRFPGPSPKLENQNFRDCAQGSVLFECSSNDSDPHAGLETTSLGQKSLYITHGLDGDVHHSQATGLVCGVMRLRKQAWD